MHIKSNFFLKYNLANSLNLNWYFFFDFLFSLVNIYNRGGGGGGGGGGVENEIETVRLTYDKNFELLDAFDVRVRTDRWMDEGWVWLDEFYDKNCASFHKKIFGASCNKNKGIESLSQTLIF